MTPADQIRFGVHVHHSANRFDGVVGVERGEDKVTCQTGLNANTERLGVAHFTNEHDVGVLSKEGTHNLGKSHFLRDLDLSDIALVFIFDGIFDRDDVP